AVVQEKVAEHFFSPREVAVLRALPTPLQATACFACWTRKEAYIKATGDGLALPLDQFAVSLAPGEPAALLHTTWDPQEAARWALQDLAPAPGYRAAVAVAGHDWHLTCWDGPVAYVDVSNSPHGASQGGAPPNWRGAPPRDSAAPPPPTSETYRPNLGGGGGGGIRVTAYRRGR